ncbi:MAG TPA: response regulator transcription factor [Solirubrobacteraceae bacterium]
MIGSRSRRQTRATGREGLADATRVSQTSNPSNIKLVLVGGNRLLRGATASLLATQEGFEVQGTFASAARFLAGGSEIAPDVVLLDCDGKADVWGCAVSVLSRTHPAIKLVMLCQKICPETIRCAMEHRVSGVILKSYSAEDISEAILYMASGRTIMPAGWQRSVAAIPRDPLALSPRLRQILTLIAQGRSNEAIAGELGLSPNTIKFHVHALYTRLGVRNRVEAASLYAQMTRGER